jgi:hypothetical protein
VSTAGMRSSSLQGRIHGVPRQRPPDPEKPKTDARRQKYSTRLGLPAALSDAELIGHPQPAPRRAPYRRVPAGPWTLVSCPTPDYRYGAGGV